MVLTSMSVSRAVLGDQSLKGALSPAQPQVHRLNSDSLNVLATGNAKKHMQVRGCRGGGCYVIAWFEDQKAVALWWVVREENREP